jgi:hypothetical protein
MTRQELVGEIGTFWFDSDGNGWILDAVKVTIRDGDWYVELWFFEGPHWKGKLVDIPYVSLCERLTDLMNNPK